MTSGHSSSSAAQARDGLHALLCSLFPGSGEDLRRFARGDPARASVVDSVTWSAGLDAIVHDFIERCEARGLVDEGLFRRLLLVRRHRRPEIERAAEQWGYSLPLAPTPRRSAASLGLAALGLVGLAGLGAVMLPSLTQHTAQDPPVAERADEAPAAPPMAPIPVAPDPPQSDEPTVPPEPVLVPTEPPRKPASMRRCQPLSKPELLGRLKAAGHPGGILSPCWDQFRAQATITARACEVHLHGTSARQSTLTFTNSKHRMAETRCLSSTASRVLSSVNDCAGAIDYTFNLAEIEPP